MIQQLKKALCFDETVCHEEFNITDKHHGFNLQYNSYELGAEKENARLAPLHEALVECVEVLNLLKDLHSFNIKYDPPAKTGTSLFCIMNKSKEALTKLEARLKEMG